MKTNTPILDAVRRMHAQDDAQPLTRTGRADPLQPAPTPAQLHEAEQILACFETTLTLEG